MIIKYFLINNNFQKDKNGFNYSFNFYIKDKKQFHSQNIKIFNLVSIFLNNLI